MLRWFSTALRAQGVTTYQPHPLCLIQRARTKRHHDPEQPKTRGYYRGPPTSSKFLVPVPIVFGIEFWLPSK